ncbi:MAG: nitrite reductase small subunit NirD [Actinomycetota bacterium]|jgi:nitrite reductase (NADH) small subunit|nr:nitrite reductase small subunit NirD [Actinomycetota bacterium]
MTGSEQWTRVCAEDDIPFLEGRRVEVGGFYVGVFNTEEGFYAVFDVCPHRGGPLSDGDIAGATVTCPLHARKIDLKTGEVLNDDLSCTFTFPVKVEDGSIYLDTKALSALGAASPA